MLVLKDVEISGYHERATLTCPQAHLIRTASPRRKDDAKDAVTSDGIIECAT